MVGREVTREARGVKGWWWRGLLLLLLLLLLKEQKDDAELKGRVVRRDVFVIALG